MAVGRSASSGPIVVRVSAAQASDTDATWASDSPGGVAPQGAPIGAMSAGLASGGAEADGAGVGATLEPHAPTARTTAASPATTRAVDRVTGAKGSPGRRIRRRRRG